MMMVATWNFFALSASVSVFFYRMGEMYENEASETGFLNHRAKAVITVFIFSKNMVFH